MDRTADEDREYGSLVAHGLLMALVYFVATDVLGFLFVLASKTGLLPVSSIPWPGFQLISVVSIILVGGIVIRMMHGTREECGLVFRKDEPYLLHAVLIGAAAAVAINAALLLKSMLFQQHEGLAFPPFRHIPHPGIWGMAAMEALYGTVRAFLLFGVMLAYLMRKTSIHFRFGLWDIPMAGIVVLVITMIPGLLSLTRQMSDSGSVFLTVTLIPALCAGVVTLASSYWFERSRSLAAPMIAFGLFTGLFPVLFNLRFLLLQ